MTCRHHRHPGITAEAAGLALGRRVQYHADIHQAGGQQAIHFVVADLQRHHLDTRIQPTELTQQGRQERRQHHGETGQADGATLYALGGIDGAADAFQGTDHAACVLYHRQANGGGQGLAVFPTEQLHTQGLLDQRQCLAGRRLGHADALGGAGDVTGVCHGHDHAPMHQVHHGSSSPYGSAVKD
ncbi:hypothetical protein D3C73_838360 [compost metagenome]